MRTFQGEEWLSNTASQSWSGDRIEPLHLKYGRYSFSELLGAKLKWIRMETEWVNRNGHWEMETS